MYRIPKNGEWKQLNKGDIFGNIYSSLGLDLRTNPGKMRVSPRMEVITKDNDGGISNFGLPIGISSVVLSGVEVNIVATGAGGPLATGSGKAFANSSIGFGALTAVASSPSTINDAFSDMVSWNGKDSNTLKRIYISTYGGASHDISQYDGSWKNTWFSSTRSGTGLINGAPVHLCSGFNGNLYIAQEFQIMYAPTTGNIVAPSSTTDANTTAGTIHTLGKYIITWMRSNSNRVWVGLIESSSASKSHQGGYVGEWDGSGTAFLKIHKINAPMAMSCAIVEDVPYVIDAYGILRKYDGTNFKEVARLPVANLNYEMPGIYDQYNNIRWIHPRGMTVINDRINILLNNYVSSGVYVNEMPSGVWEFDPSNEKGGIYHKHAPCADSNDYGQQFVANVGALHGQRITGGNLLAGVSYYTDSGATTRIGLFYDNVNLTTGRRGLFTTTWLDSAQIVDNFERLFYRFRQFVSGSMIVGKYRTDKSANLPIVSDITWVSTTVFTTTDANYQYVSDRDEVEVVQGKGASKTAHVFGAPVLGAGTYTVTLDEAIGFTSGTAKVRTDNFHKVGVISKLNSGAEFLSLIQKDNSIQIKTELRDEGGMELNDVTIINTTHQKAE